MGSIFILWTYFFGNPSNNALYRNKQQLKFPKFLFSILMVPIIIRDLFKIIHTISDKIQIENDHVTCYSVLQQIKNVHHLLSLLLNDCFFSPEFHQYSSIIAFVFFYLKLQETTGKQ